MHSRKLCSELVYNALLYYTLGCLMYAHTIMMLTCIFFCHVDQEKTASREEGGSSIAIHII